VALALLGALIWAALRWQYEARLALRDDAINDYKRKLDGATPDEAAQRIAVLEDKVRTLEHNPRLLTQEQLDRMAAVLKRNAVGKISIMRDNSGLQSVGVQRQMRKLFQGYGRDVEGGATIDDFPSPEGLILVSDPRSEPPEEGIVRQALDAAGIKYGVFHQQRLGQEPVQIIFNDPD
jgi:hypothetical protein